MPLRSLWKLGIGGFLIIAFGCTPEWGMEPSEMASVSDGSPAWSPSGRLVAYVHTNPIEPSTGKPSGLYLLDLHTGVERLLLAEPFLFSPSWSPDETHLAFADFNGIWSIRADGDSLRAVYPQGGWPNWLPDGRSILFGINGELQTIAIGDTSPAIVGISGFFFDLQLCRNGQEVLACTYPGGGRPPEICRISLPAGQVTLLTSDDIDDRSPACGATGQVVWSRWPTDSKRVHPEIWIMDSTGTGRRRLASVDSNMSWNPTGTAFVFSGHTVAGPRLFVMNADGSGLRELTR